MLQPLNEVRVLSIPTLNPCCTALDSRHHSSFMLSTNPWMSTRNFPCRYTIVRKEAKRRTAHREKDSRGQLFTVFVRAVSLLLLAGTFHEHLLAHQHPPAAPLPSHGFMSRFNLHLPICTPYPRLQNLTRPRNASVHSQSPIAVATSFRGSQSPGSQEALFQS